VCLDFNRIRMKLKTLEETSSYFVGQAGSEQGQEPLHGEDVS
jgi:hypothetical protein